MSKDTTARVVLITGAARGQGLAHAQHLASHGHTVVLADLLDEAGEQAAAAIRDAGGAARYVHLNVTDEDAWQDVVADIIDRHGSFDGLVNNAGIIRVTNLADCSLSEWSLLNDVNATSVFLGTRQAARNMSPGGSIVNVSSTAALVGSAGYGAYSASKASIVGLTRVAAVELAPRNIRVNAICPGGVDTPMNLDEPPGGSSSGTPLGRRARPEEISPLIGYLLGPASTFVTGAAWPVDGGLTTI